MRLLYPHHDPQETQPFSLSQSPPLTLFSNNNLGSSKIQIDAMQLVKVCDDIWFTDFTLYGWEANRKTSVVVRAYRCSL